MNNTDSLSIPMTMGDWVLIMESVSSRLKEIDSIDTDSTDDDVMADLYTDQQNLKGLLGYIKIEFKKEYGALPE
ncbi:hypothetical protein [Sessilibacter corallicola]|uniref:hypothetical protein n=1 Tax=Sessilibacter corallicola TaxID=2904075 RepID=UPI001E43DF9D|nr:hypothetical protein [Sessilibacter corallicola]MCE2029558.1 hypothetical protein [Sessilibacter corallicola]